MERSDLPYREKTELFLLNENWNLLVEDHTSYLMFPGWGIDENEKNSIEASAIRELKEETWLPIIWNLTYGWSVERDWFPERANNEKRKKRYKKYKWEKVHIFTWKVEKKQVDIELNEEDSREDISWIDLDAAIVKHQEYSKTDHINTIWYREAQLNAINSLKEIIK